MREPLCIERCAAPKMRDPRIDFFRGLAIYMIFVDHVIGDPLATFTYHSIGLSDAAEIFVFLSGIASGIAYSRTFARKGFTTFVSVIIKRAGRIYLYYALSSTTIILIAAAATIYLGLERALVLATPPNDLITAVWLALCFISPPELSNILVLYIAFTVSVVPVIVIAGLARWRLTLAASGLIWVGAQFLSDFLVPLTHHWVLNPFAWQFLFAVGMVIGMKEERPVFVWRNPSHLRRAVMAAWTIVIGAALYRLLSSRSGLDIAWLRIDPATWYLMKVNLSCVRLLHFLSVAFLVAVYLRNDNPLLKLRVFAPVIKTGVRSLEAFSLSVILTVVVNIVVLTVSPSVSHRLIIDSIAMLVLALTSIALAHRGARVATGGGQAMSTVLPLSEEHARTRRLEV